MTIVIIINPVRIRKTKHPNQNQLNTGYFVLLQQTFSQVTEELIPLTIILIFNLCNHAFPKEVLHIVEEIRNHL